MFDGVPVTPEQREAAAQKILFPVRRARDESTQLATAFYNDEAVRSWRQPSRPRRSPFYPREAVEAVLERATASKVRVDGLDVIPATPTQTVRVEGLEVAPTRGVVIEGLDDLGVELEHARVEIDESNRRDPAVVEKVNLRVDRAIIRHIEQAARDTIVAAVEAEEERSGGPIGWARVLTGAESCGFCAMLASRGPVYATEWLAQHRGNDQVEGKYHDGCDCIVVPVFDPDDWIGREAYENLEQLWIDSDDRKDFEKRFRQIRADGDDFDKYIGAKDVQQGTVKYLPIDVTVQASPGGATTDPRYVMSIADLELFDAIAPHDKRLKFAKTDEVPIAKWLDSRGVAILSVREFKKRTPPDAVVDTHRRVPLEFKRLTTSGRFSHIQAKKHISDGSKKCRRVVLDARVTGATVQDAEKAIAESVSECGTNLDEVVIIVGDGVGVGWSRA